jgi:DivIVA domain-containing protein
MRPFRRRLRGYDPRAVDEFVAALEARCADAELRLVRREDQLRRRDEALTAFDRDLTRREAELVRRELAFQAWEHDLRLRQAAVRSREAAMDAAGRATHPSVPREDDRVRLRRRLRVVP